MRGKTIDPKGLGSDASGQCSQDADGLIATLAPISSRQLLTKGEVLFNEGDADNGSADGLYWIVHGMLDISVLSPEGRRLTLDIARDGAVIGEITMFDPGPRTATVTALEATELRVVRHGDVLHAIAEDSDLALALFRIAGQRMRWMNGQMMEQATLVAPVRVARRLLYLTRDSNEELHLSQEELADFSGTTREAVSRAFKGWKKAGLIEVSRRGIRVLDRATLEALADIDD